VATRPGCDVGQPGLVPALLTLGQPFSRLLVTVEGGRVRAVEQFIGDPAAVAAFWA
jgi:hypothetical protein